MRTTGHGTGQIVFGITSENRMGIQIRLSNQDNRQSWLIPSVEPASRRLQERAGCERVWECARHGIVRLVFSATNSEPRILASSACIRA